VADAPAIPAIVGPTGIGKSAVALAIAEQIGAEVVAVDAFTVYRGMDIGTAKPTAAERRRVRHHMVDVLDPSEASSVEWFQSAARAAIDEVLLRGRTPLLVGGSGLYFRAVIDPLEFPPTDAGVRAGIEARYAGDVARAHADLARVDPDAAARMDPGNLRRAVRALEVRELTGRRFSDWRLAWDSWEPAYPGLVVIGLSGGRPALAPRLDARVDAMLANGWLDECRRLSTVALSATARQAIGYAELLDHLAGNLDYDRAVERIKVRTRQYAARQDRWFRADPRVQWTTAANAPELVRTLCDF
jgi:tRNA dimethylallyltransferase